MTTDDAAQITNAIYLAMNAHRNQERRTIGGAYIMHPIRVANFAAKLGLTPSGIAAAYLHDVVEDTEYTIDHLRLHDVSDRTLHIVQLLTKWWPDDQDSNVAQLKEVYYGRIMEDMEALAIKILDRSDNLYDMSYMVLRPSATRGDARWAGRYLAKTEAEMDKLTAANKAFPAANGLLWAQAASLRAALDDYSQRNTP